MKRRKQQLNEVSILSNVVPSIIISHIDNHTSFIDQTERISFQITKDEKLIQKYVDCKVEIKLFCCSLCTDIFSDRESLLRHLSFKHSDIDPENVPYETSP